MTTTIVAYGFGFLLIAIVIGVGWWQIREGGKRSAELKESKVDLKEANKDLSRRTNPVAAPGEWGDRLRKQAKRLARLRDREAGTRDDAGDGGGG